MHYEDAIAQSAEIPARIRLVRAGTRRAAAAGPRAAVAAADRHVCDARRRALLRILRRRSRLSACRPRAPGAALVHAGARGGLPRGCGGGRRADPPRRSRWGCARLLGGAGGHRGGGDGAAKAPAPLPAVRAAVAGLPALRRVAGQPLFARNRQRPFSTSKWTLATSSSATSAPCE